MRSRATAASGIARAALLVVGALVLSALSACNAESGPAPPAGATEPGEPVGPVGAVGAVGAGSPAAPDRDAGFEEVARRAGLDFHMTFLEGEQGAKFKINLYDHGAGVSVGDVDGDGRDDILLLNQLGPNALFRNQGDGTFTDITAASGIDLPDRICSSSAFADYDNDGDQDLFIASTRGGNVLFRNHGDGTFENVSEAAGVAHVGHSQGVTFFDYDGDGLLDLLVTNTAGWTFDTHDPEGRYHIGRESLWDLVDSKNETNLLYHNRGDGTFEEVAAAMGVAGDGWGGDVAVFDMDGDVDLDLFITNMFGESTLFRNDGGTAFVDVTREAMGHTPWGAVGCKAFDQDGDGDLDLYVTDMHSDMWMPWGELPVFVDPDRRYGGPEGAMHAAGRMGRDDVHEQRAMFGIAEEDLDYLVFGNAMFRNDGGGRFADVNDSAKTENLWPWGIAAADFDLDGFEDVFIPRGMGYPYDKFDNELLMNARDGTMVSRAKEEGIAPRPDGPWLKTPIGGEDAASSSRCVAVLDYDSDGRPDLVVNNFNERAYLYRNRFPERPWVAFRLRGTDCNRDAIGAVVRVTAGGRTQIRQVQAAGGYLAQSTLALHFGLDDATAIDACTITWPDGLVQTLDPPAPGRLYAITQPAAD